MISRQLVYFGLTASWGFCVVQPFDACAATINLSPVADTAIYSAFPTFNFGGGPTITAGGRPRGGESRALMLFDVDGNLPAGAIIQSVSLRLNVVETPPSGAVNSMFDLNVLTSSWGEGTGADRGGTPAGPNAATWNNRFGTSGSPWATPGGDFLSSVAASVSVQGNGSYIFLSNPNLVAEVQSWADDPAGNFGWLLQSESALTGGTIRRFGSRADSASSPTLTIQYTTVPEPGACSLLMLGLFGFAWRRHAPIRQRPLDQPGR
jgi:hypothetical protein